MMDHNSRMQGTWRTSSLPLSNYSEAESLSWTTDIGIILDLTKQPIIEVIIKQKSDQTWIVALPLITSRRSSPRALAPSTRRTFRLYNNTRSRTRWWGSQRTRRLPYQCETWSARRGGPVGCRTIRSKQFRGAETVRIKDLQGEKRRTLITNTLASSAFSSSQRVIIRMLGHRGVATAPASSEISKRRWTSKAQAEKASSFQEKT